MAIVQMCEGGWVGRLCAGLVGGQCELMYVVLRQSVPPSLALTLCSFPWPTTALISKLYIFYRIFNLCVLGQSGHWTAENLVP